MKNYFIANDAGKVLAHDIQSRDKAEAILHDYLADNPNEIDNGWEIMEEE